MVSIERSEHWMHSQRIVHKFVSAEKSGISSCACVMPNVETWPKACMRREEHFLRNEPGYFILPEDETHRHWKCWTSEARSSSWVPQARSRIKQFKFSLELGVVEWALVAATKYCTIWRVRTEPLAPRRALSRTTVLWFSDLKRTWNSWQAAWWRRIEVFKKLPKG